MNCQTLSDEALEQLLRGGENDHVEFKESLSGSAPEALREAVCAFANDLPGRDLPGVAFIGVRDDGTPANLSISDELLRQLANIRTDGNITPPPSMQVEKRTIAGHTFAVLTVHPSDSPPVRYKGRIKIRTGPRKDNASAQDERILNERRLSGSRPYDLRPVPGSTLKDLSLRRFSDEYLHRAFAPEVLEANGRSEAEQLAATKMIVEVQDSRATVLGMLLLGIRVRDFFPGAYVQFLRVAGAELSDPIVDSAEIDGCITEVLQQLDQKIAAHNFTAVDLTSGPLERRTPHYPSSALQQISRNAVMHRSYEATHAPVRVTWFDDRIEITSPGGSFGMVNAANFGEPGITDYRNPNLAEAMKVLGFVQRFGVGIATAKRALHESGHPPPTFDVSQSAINVIIHGRQK
ncbi:MAG: ATP-binding protein [Polyangiales bacterium]